MKNTALRRVLALLLCAFCLVSASAAAFADKNPLTGKLAQPTPWIPTGPGSHLAEEETTVTVAFDEIFHSSGETVYNNGGTVYNNGGTVYNNGGTVYNNSGVVYNNGGTVYNNGAEVYNNMGTVQNNGGIVHEHGEEAQAEAEPFDGLYRVTPSADYGALASISGAETDGDGNYLVDENTCLIFKAKDGLYIDQATTTTGSCAVDTAGNTLLNRVNRNGSLDLRFKAYAPQADTPSGAYSAPFELKLSAGEAVEIRYTTDGSSPNGESSLYEGAVKIDRSCVLKAAAIAEGADSSSVLELTYIFPIPGAPEFGTLEEGYEVAETLPLTLRNPGLGTVLVESVRLVGKDSKAFVLSGRTESPVRVTSGQTDERSWSVTPAAGLKAGIYEAEAVFAYASGDHGRVKISLEVK